ncbi:hypothetical protein R1flu_015701 [Riccia fluitans]|uniref:Uncharacterized protein n=1 Tax=Riccia fluitans TaxID=41844 RepID=A0ABD1YKK0_9MARC
MMNAVANAVSRSVLVGPSMSLHQQRCRIHTSCCGACSSSSSVRLVKQNSANGEMARMSRYQCAATLPYTQRASTVETDWTLFQTSVDAERCAEEGISCYSNEQGEITCEGFDEGPHFHPAARTQQRIVMKNARCISLLTRGDSPSAAGDDVENVVEVEERGERYCEGKDES